MSLTISKPAVPGIWNGSMLGLLAQLYQRRLFYYLYALAIVFSLPYMIKLNPATTTCFVNLIISLIACIIWGSNSSQPLSFCLPGQRLVLRRLLFGIGLTGSLLTAQLFWMHEKLSWMLWPLQILGAAGVGFTVYALILRAGVPKINNVFIFMIFFTHGWIFFVVFGYVDVPAVAIMQSWWGGILTGALSAWMLWRHLGKTDLYRRGCSRPGTNFLNLRPGISIQQLQQAEYWRKEKSPAMPRFSNFFFRRMQRCRADGWGRAAWGGFYEMLSLNCNSQLSARMLWCSTFLLLSLYFPYESGLGSGIGAALLFVSFCLGSFSSLYFPLWNPMLLPGGRKERFHTCFWGMLGLTIVMALAFTLVSMLAMGAGSILPSVHLLGRAFHFQPFDIRIAYLPPFCLIPIAGIGLSVFRKGRLTFIAGLTIALTGFFGIILLYAHRHILGELCRFETFVFLSLILWLAFALILRWRCRRATI